MLDLLMELIIKCFPQFTHTYIISSDKISQFSPFDVNGFIKGDKVKPDTLEFHSN